MKSILSLGLCVAALAGLLPTARANAADACTQIVATGHPQYPAIAFKDGDAIAGAASTLVAGVAKDLNIPLQPKYMGTWEEAQAAARDGKADMIYYNEERAAYLDYVDPAFIFDPVVVFVAKGKAFPYKGEDDLIGKKGVTNQGESYGTEFDDFIKTKLTVARSDGIDDAFKDLLSGKADYVIAGYYPGLAEAAKQGIKDQVQPLDPAVLSAEMYVAFSKKSPCRDLVAKFGEGITAKTTDGEFSKMLTDAEITWENAQHAPK